jgi:hypothetical protein
VLRTPDRPMAAMADVGVGVATWPTLAFKTAVANGGHAVRRARR